METKLARIKDNSLDENNELAKVPELTKKIANKTLKQLIYDEVFVFPEIFEHSEDLVEEEMIIQSDKSGYRTNNVMGFLGCGDERLVIESRFSSDEDDCFLQYLMEKVLGYPNILKLDINANQENRLFNLLLFIFPAYLKKAIRKGVFKIYIRNRYNDPRIKGAIDIARHIKENTPFTGNIAYSQREFSYNNDMIKLIRHTIEFIKTKDYGNKLLETERENIAQIISLTPDYKLHDRGKVIYKNKAKPIKHAYYHEYRALQRLCIMILQYESHQISSWDMPIWGVLFDGAWLWEEYVNLLIEDKFYHPRNKVKKGEKKRPEHLFNINSAPIYPDFISKDAGNRVIADAKYKPFSNIANKDYQQLLAYMFRFDAKKGLYLCPEKEGEFKEYKLNRGSTYENNVKQREDITVYKCGLSIPSGITDYNVFIGKMEENKQAFITKIVTEIMKQA
jgi:5-methylcytosine-specific restriction endonuclease McrBC regulatory subunit McrC